MITNLTDTQIEELGKIVTGGVKKSIDEVLPNCSAEDKAAAEKQLDVIKNAKSNAKELSDSDLDIAGGLDKKVIGAICTLTGVAVGVGGTLVVQKIVKDRKSNEDNDPSTMPSST